MRHLWVLQPCTGTRRHLLQRALLTALLLASVGVGTVSALDWQIETVDSNGTYVGDWMSLVLDSAGNPHISHSGGGLRYAAYIGSAWETQIVDPVSVWTGTSLALDAAGNPHIGYCDNSNYYLKYAA